MLHSRCAQQKWTEMMKILAHSPCLVLLAFLLGACGNICRVGQELGAGESCTVPGSGTFSVRADGCAGELPLRDGDSVTLGSTRFFLSDRERTTCITGFVETGGFRASEIATRPTSHWRIDTLP